MGLGFKNQYSEPLTAELGPVSTIGTLPEIVIAALTHKARSMRPQVSL